MSVLVKKRILISPEQLSSEVGAFFRELGFEISADYDKSLNAEYLFIIDDHLPELRFFPRIQTKTSLPQNCMPDVRSYVDISHLNDPSVKKLLSSYFSDAQNFDLVDSYSKDYKNIYSIKVHDYLNVGYFIDTIIIEAYKLNFDFEQIRNYLNLALPFALKLSEKEQNLAPLNVSFSYSDEGFAVQISLESSEFSFKNPTVSEFYSHANYFDATVFKKRKRVMLSALWFKEEKLRNFRSHFFTEISGRSASHGSSLIHIIDEVQETPQYAVQSISDDLSSSIKIKGTKDQEIDEFQRILGQKSPEDFASLRVSGADGNENDEEWKVKSSGLAEKIQDEIIKIKGLDQEVSEDDLVRIISSELGVDQKATTQLVKGMLDEATENIRIKSSAPDTENVQVKNNAPDPAKEKLEQQVLRMKNVIEQMKTEMLRLRSLELGSGIPESGLEPGQQSAERLELKKALDKSLEAVKNKEKMAIKQKSDFEQILEAKDEKIHSLETRIEELKDEFSRSREFATEEKLEALTTENKSLMARLDLANRKINIINENMERHGSEANVKKDKEISTLKSNMQMAQALIEKFKQERNDFEIKLQEEREKRSNVRDEKTDNGATEKDKQLLMISSEKKILEDKMRAQSIELKKLDQKLKFTVAQLEESQRKRTIQPAQAAAKSNDAYIKQLDQANSRLTNAATDLADRKKEIHKMKQENALLSSKIVELERKLSNMEKKAA